MRETFTLTPQDARTVESSVAGLMRHPKIGKIDWVTMSTTYIHEGKEIELGMPVPGNTNDPNNIMPAVSVVVRELVTLKKERYKMRRVSNFFPKRDEVIAICDLTDPDTDRILMPHELIQDGTAVEFERVRSCNGPTEVITLLDSLDPSEEIE